MLERIAYLTELGIDQSLGEINNVLVRRYARRLAARSPSVNARIKEPARTVELACFLRYSLLTATDQLILMFQRRVADLWRHCADGVTASVDWAQQYQQFLQELTDLATREAVADVDLRARLAELIAAKRQQRAPSRASVIRLRLIDAIAPVRSLLVAVSKLPWQASGEHPVLDALGSLQVQYSAGTKSLPADVAAPRLGPAWREVIADADRERAFRGLEGATLFALRRALRNGSGWIEHSLSFRGRERLFLPEDRWKIAGRSRRADTTPGCSCRPRAATSSLRCLLACAPELTPWLQPHERARCVWMTSCTWLRRRLTRKTPQWSSCAPGSINASMRFNCQRSSWRWTPKCASAGSCSGASPDPARNC